MIHDFIIDFLEFLTYFKYKTHLIITIISNQHKGFS